MMDVGAAGFYLISLVVGWLGITIYEALRNPPAHDQRSNAVMNEEETLP